MSESNVIEPEKDLSTVSDDASTTDNADFISDLDSEENNHVDLGDDKAPEPTINKAAEQRSKQVETWSERYYNGDIELSEVPKWIQKEINKADTPNEQESFDKKFEARIKKERDNDSYNALKESLNDIAMTKAQREALKKNFQDLKKDGIAKGKALKLAMKIANVETSKRSKVKNPVTSGSDNVPDNTESYSSRRKNMSMEERRKELLKEIA